MRYAELRRRVTAVARKAYDRGLVAATSGNYSQVDRPAGLMVITPSGLDYSLMAPEDLVVMDLAGNVVEGDLPPSSEWRLHARLYRAREDIGAVAHTHSPYATAFATLDRPIPNLLIELQMFCGGAVNVAPFALPGSEELGEGAARTIGDRKAVLLSHHGTVAVGDTVEDALKVAFWVEDTARIAHLALTIGQPKELEEVSRDLGGQRLPAEY